MNRESQVLTRSRVIARHVQLALAGGMQMRAYAAAVADAYMARTAVADRVVDFHVGTTTDAAEKAIRANAQLCNRFIDGTVKMPADLEESFVLSLPEDARMRCKAELAARYGLLAARVPDASAAGGAKSAANLMREVAEFITESITADACPNEIALRAALRELTDVEAACATARAQLDLQLAQLKDGTVGR